MVPIAARGKKSRERIEKKSFAYVPGIRAGERFLILWLRMWDPGSFFVLSRSDGAGDRSGTSHDGCGRSAPNNGDCDYSDNHCEGERFSVRMLVLPDVER